MDALQETSVNFDASAQRHNRYQQRDSGNLFRLSLLAELHENAIAPICWPFQLLSSSKSQHPSWMLPTELEIQSELSDSKVSQP